jgi:hypothetical protein
MRPVCRLLALAAVLAAGAVFSAYAGGAEASAQPVGVVSHVKVLSDKVQDVSSMEAWKKSFIKEGMSDQEKALAAWKTRATFVYQDPPPIEFLHEGCVHDPIKSFNVYGYGMCCCASSNVEALARYVGLEARGWAINGHSVPEVGWDGAWHMLDASLVNYFSKPDGKIASVEDIVAAVRDWYEKNPEYKNGGGKSLGDFQKADGWTGWKRGPALLANCPLYDAGGWWPARTHGWSSTMQEFNGSGKTPFQYEYGYSQGYEVNIQLRPGERLTRNWFHKGLHVNGMLKDGDAPGCLTQKVGNGSMAFLRQYGDLTDGRVGSGRLEYDVPPAGAGLRASALKMENVATKAEDGQGPAVHVKDAAQPGILEIRMPTSYVYLTGSLDLAAVVGDGGKIRVLLSDNNGLDWKDVLTVEKPGEQTVDLGKFVLRRYDYRLRLVLSGKGTGLERLRITHDIQCSQRALPTLGRGENTITFSAGPQEGTVTIEGSTQGKPRDKQVTPMDFHPVLNGVAEEFFRVKGKPAEVSFAIATPGDMMRLKFGGHFRARDKGDRWQAQVSFDGGKTFKTVDTYAGPTQGQCRYATVSDVPAAAREAVVRWSGVERNTACLFLVRIDADYRQPFGGFRPVKITYVWEEAGVEKRDVHVARLPEETYKISCQTKPEMKSVILELE